MANWIKNYVRFINKNCPEDKGLAGKVRCYLMDTGDEVKGNVSFDKIIPVPYELRTVESGNLSIGVNRFIEKYTNYRKIFKEMLDSENSEMIKFFGKDYKNNADKICRYFDLYEKYGYTDWHEARCAMWGCGYEASETEIIDGGISFYTPWSPPLKVFEHLVKAFSNLIIEVTFTSECEYEPHCFRYEWKDGKLVRAIIMPNDDYKNFKETASAEKKSLTELATECMGMVISHIYPIEDGMAFSE